MAFQEIKKMKQGMSYSRKEKTIILNVLKYFSSEYPDKSVTELVRRTARATGCSEKSIFQFRKEEGSAEGLKQPSKTKVRKNININSRDIKYDQNVRLAIRNIIHDLKCKTMTPSLGNILKQIQLDVSLPKFSLMTLRRLLFDMGFYYEKNGNKFELLERDDKTNEKKFTITSNVMKFNHIHPEDEDKEILINSYEEIITVSNNTQTTENTPTLPLPPNNIASNMSTNIMGHPLGQQGLRSEPLQFNQHDTYMYNHHNIHMMGGVMPRSHHHQMPNMNMHAHAKPPHIPHWVHHSASHPAPLNHVPKQI